MVVPTIADFAFVALVGCAAGAVFSAGKSETRRHRLRPAGITALGVSVIPGGLLLLVLAGGITGLASLLHAIFACFAISTAAFILFGIPFVIGALLVREKRPTNNTHATL